MCDPKQKPFLISVETHKYKMQLGVNVVYLAGFPLIAFFRYQFNLRGFVHMFNRRSGGKSR